ncbi:hypothetical protein GJ496_009992 [Pomphorhynchus laevis]|nr:hypothetical protein GJ496_009992 [Pomphorhynchus laevis]
MLSLIGVKVIFQKSPCPITTKPGNILVHLVAHSHLDVGWLKTVDQYYYGLNDQVQSAGVQYIYDTVVYFRYWYLQQPEHIKILVFDLIHDGQLSFANGGWVMSDEACTHYRATIDQMTLGRSFLNRNFGILPNVSWQIDTFGHSSVHIELVHYMNMNAAIINRIDYRKGNQMREDKTNEFCWAFGNSKYDCVLTSRMYNHYSPPEGFCFDEFCKGEPVIDGDIENEHLNNAKSKASEILAYLEVQGKVFNSKHLLLPMGSDFHYQNAHHTFKNIDALLRATQSYKFNETRDNIEIKYSTPECYLNAIRSDLKNITTHKKDFLPYCHRPFSCWTSFYTSRQGLKQLERISGSLIQTLRQLIFQSENRDVNNDLIFELENAHAIVQHHDAIT